MSKKIRVVKHYSGVYSGVNTGVGVDSRPVLSKSVCAAMLAGSMLLGGGVFVSPAYADGYVSGDGARVYYGYRADADYSKDRLLIKVTYYKTKADALKGENDGVDPLGKFVRVEYTSNNPEDSKKEPDKWALRPTWWFGVPKGLKTDTISQIRLVRNERGTQEASSPDTPGAKKLSKALRKGYVVASDHTYNNIDQWKHSVSRDYYSGDDQTIDGKGWQRMVGITKNEKDYDNSGNTKGQWDIYKDGNANGLQGIFADWESAGQRYYEMSYVAEMTDDAWKQRDQKPLLFVAGIYRGVGNWRYVAGTTMRAPKIADHLELKYPKPTPVKDLEKLDSNEQEAVKTAINGANKSADTKNPNLFDQLVAENGVSVDTKGNATITFTDGTKRVMPASLLVLKNETDKDKYKPTLPARTPVVKPSKLTDEDKKTVIAAFKKANPDSSEFSMHLAKNNAIAFDADGKNLVVTYEDGSTLEIPASDLVYQGATIADWAPYRVPVPTEVDDPSQALTKDQKTAIASAFDEANNSFPVYQDAKKHNKNTSPVTFDDKNNAVITWADGSQTTIPAWQFLKKKQTQSQKTEQKQTTKEFTVDLPATPAEVTFDPFDKTATIDQKQLTNLEASLQALTAKDASDSNKTVTLTSAKIDIATGTVTFKAKGYEDRKYPIGIFYKKQSTGTGTQNPTQKNEETKEGYKYKIPHINIAGDSPTLEEGKQALKQFITLNYDGKVPEIKYDGSSNTITIEDSGLTAKDQSMTPYGGSGDGHIVDVMVSHLGDITINYDPTPAKDKDDPNDHETTLSILINSEDIYIKKNNNKDNTIDQLKALAKQLLKEKKDLTKSDFTRAGLDKDKITDKAIDEMTDAGKLRDLIKKLSEAKHADRTYNSIGDVVVKDPKNPTKEDFEKAVEAFVKANYDKSDNFHANDVTTTLPTDLTSKSGTIDMDIADDNIKSVTSSKTGDTDDYKSMVFKDAKATQLFTVAISYKKKEETPKLSDNELNEMRKQAKETIDHNPNLTKKDKEGFDNRIDVATNAEQIQEILNEAAKKAAENAKSTNPTVSNEISGNQNGTDAENQQKLDAAKEAAKDIISKLPNLSDDEKNTLKGKVDKATSVDGKDGVNSVVDEAKKLSELNTAKKEVEGAQLYFLDHGTGDDKNNAATTHADDVALHELLGGTSVKDQTLTDLEDALKATNATADSINKALAKAKLQNTSNEQNAKNAGIAKLEAKKAELDAAYNALTEEQKKNATKDYTAATTAIETAKTTVDSATKPSDITGALNKVNTALTAANTAVENAKGKRDTSSITNDQNSELNKEKEAQKKRINGSDLPDAEKQKAIKDIEAATMLGDPTGIANRYLKAQKIEDAKKQIAALEYLNKAQKQYYKDLLDSTDASDHVDEAGKPTGKDDIDDALDQALNLNGVMKRLADLATSADALKKDDKDKKYSSADKAKKDAFDAALNAANTQLDKVKGADSDNINADGANALYNDLLKAMQALDSSVKGVGLYTDDLQKEYKADVDLKEKPVYKNATKNVKEAFDKALEDAKAALDNAKDANKVTQLGATAAVQQNAIGAALANLVNARKALDGKKTEPTPTPSVDKSGLKDLVDAAVQVKDSDAYKYADADKQGAYDKAISDGQNVLAKTGATADDVANAVQAITTAKTALDGKKTEPTPTPSVDKSHLQQGINGSGDVKKSDDYTNAPSDKKQAYDHALDHANEVNNNPNATQDQVNQAVEDLKKAEHDLKPTPNPLPTPGAGTGNTGSGSEAGYGVNDNAPTTVDKGELNIQIDSAESDLQPGNAGNGNAGTNNAGNAANSGANVGNAGNNNTANNNASNANANAANANNANGANSAAVNSAVENNSSVKQADAAVKQAAATLDEALAQAKRVAADPHATQEQVDAAAAKLADARKALADAQANAAKVRAAVRSRVIKGMRSRGNAGIATGANVATTGLMATMIAAIGGAFVTRRMRAKHANRD